MISQYRMVIEAWQAIQGYRFRIRYDYVSEHQVTDFTLEEIMWKAQQPPEAEMLRVLVAARMINRYVNQMQKRRLIGVGTVFDFMRDNTKYGSQLGMVPLFLSMQGSIDITTSSVFPHVRVCVTNIHLWDAQGKTCTSYVEGKDQYPTRVATQDWLYYQRVFTRRSYTLGSGESYCHIPMMTYWKEGQEVAVREKPVLDQLNDRVMQGWAEAEQLQREQRQMVRGPNGGIY